MKIISAISNGMQKTLEYLAAIFLGISCLILFTEVVLRYGFGKSAGWREELTRFLFLSSMYMMAGVAWKLDSHIKIDLVIPAQKPVIRRTIHIIIHIAAFIFTIIMIIASISLVRFVSGIGLKTLELKIPFYILYSILPLSMVLLSLYTLESFIRIFRKPQSSPKG